MKKGANSCAQIEFALAFPLGGIFLGFLILLLLLELILAVGLAFASLHFPLVLMLL